MEREYKKKFINDCNSSSNNDTATVLIKEIPERNAIIRNEKEYKCC